MHELTEHFLESKRNARKSVPNSNEKVLGYPYPYLQSLHKIERLGEVLGSIRLSNLKASDVEGYLDKMALIDTSRFHYHQYFRMLFNHATTYEFMEHNPMDRLQSPLIERRDPRILTVEQAGDLLRACYEDHDGATYLYIILGLFAGIRPHEITKLRWKDFRERHTQIRIPAEAAKTRNVRVARLPFNASLMVSDEWDRATHCQEFDPETPIVPLTHNLLRKRFRQAFKQAGVGEWPHDAVHHTFASFHIQGTESMPLLMEQLGHSTPVTSLRHCVNFTTESWVDYFSLAATKEQRAMIKKKSWTITPTSTQTPTTPSLPYARRISCKPCSSETGHGPISTRSNRNPHEPEHDHPTTDLLAGPGPAPRSSASHTARTPA